MKRAMGIFASVLALLLGGVQMHASASGPETMTFSSGLSEYTVPNGVMHVRITAVGGDGHAGTGNSAVGGQGASVQGEFTVTPGSTLYVAVDQGAGIADAEGGAGGSASWVSTCSMNSDECLGTFNTPPNDPRLITAGGGGGAGGGTGGGAGGDAGYGPFYCSDGNPGFNGGTANRGEGAACFQIGTGGGDPDSDGHGYLGGEGEQAGGAGGGGYYGAGGGAGALATGGSGGGGGASFVANQASAVVSMSNGSLTPSVTIQPLTAPGAPSGVVATPGNAQATISWQQPARDGGFDILDYTVTSYPSGFYTTVSAGQTTAVITGLTNGTSYTFTVSARNKLGDGPESVPSNAVKPKAPKKKKH